MDIKKIADLAHLSLSKSELETFEVQMDRVLKYFEELSEVNTDGVEPMVTPTSMTQWLRADKASVWESAEEAVEQAPETSGNLFKVPPVI